MVTIPQRLLGEALILSAKKNPGKTAVIFKSHEYSYSSLKENAQNLAYHLVTSGINKGDRVAVFMNNSWESVVAIYGITLAGGVFLVINPQTKCDKLNYILKDCGAKTLMTETILCSVLAEAIADTTDLKEVIVTGEISDLANISGYNPLSFDKIILKNNSNSTLPRIIPNDLAALIYTSGSTGFPKGVMMTHQSMVFTSWSLIEYLRLTEDERILLVLPLAFDYGLYQLLMSVTIGGTIIVEQSFTFQASIFRVIHKYKPTVFPGLPMIYSMMINTHKKKNISFPGIKKVTNTAAALPAEFLPELKAIFPNAMIFKMYGLTECKRVCYLEPELLEKKPASVGKAIPGTEVFLLTLDGKPVPAGEPGILHVRGPHIMAGYWNKEDLSNEMLRQGKIPGERILCSNDWFKMDEEGFLYFLGRNDDIIKSRGEKVSPLEIENTIYKISGVREVAVTGIPDGVLGESIIAFVTTHDKVKLNEKDIKKVCVTKLESFMVPQRVIFLYEMPKSSNGKIDKKELKKMTTVNG
jgi:long-chain acyl-CoA synthetase